MIDLYLPEDVQAMDRRAFARGVEPAALMDHAARHLAQGVLAIAEQRGLGRYGLRGVLLCGKGNNGGDGLAAARHLLRRGVAATCVLVTPEDELGEDSVREATALRRAGGRIVPLGEEAGEGADLGDVLDGTLRNADVAVDCLLGTGASGEPRGPFGVAVSALRRVHDRGCPVVACDLPTGVDAATGRVPGDAVVADLTVTLGAHKQGLWLHPAAEHVGQLVLGEIGVVDDEAQPVARVLESADLPGLAPPPGPRDHKRSRGVVAIHAGSDRMAGAAILCAKGALRAGAGLITVATPRAAASRISAAVPEAMTVPLPDDVDGIVAGVLEAAEKAHVLAIGPGLGLAEATQQAVRRLVTEADRTVVLDADGINAFRDHTELLEAPDGRPEDRQLVLTPQAKELGRLAGSSGHGVHARRTETAVEQARRFGATLVAKGPRSVIAAADGRVWINGTGGPALASGGTGDVLTGITAAMMAQHRDPASVAAAVHVHGLAGDLAAEHLSARATGASDVADHVAAAALELGI
ncbi:NAD(P)HX epimerase / NAD(P)HX dehydratase [Euzebya pacifica]|uniref:Bifunctional NAD(P)H-hydrate repair enzyme n=1 Tax=Euzebya pacifica TaxID=1608957 RepID=A0A346Y3N3_9ACTN|nr:NAD(P)H-hydrate dehydratase [Euzebya pacifica]AXV09080.1 NAD(P)HX epimerase / NAD(P)HX dehydratase [Euzebya pacifica]